MGATSISKPAWAQSAPGFLHVSSDDFRQRASAEGDTRIRISGVTAGASLLRVHLGALYFELKVAAGSTARQTAQALAAALPSPIRCDLLEDRGEVVMALAASRAPRVEVLGTDPEQQFLSTERNAFLIQGCASLDRTGHSFVLLTIEGEAVELQLSHGDSPQQTARRLLAVLPPKFRRALLYKDGPEETAPVRFVVLG